MRKRFFLTLGCVMTAAAIIFIIIALRHPELSFPLSAHTMNGFYGGYAAVTLLVFMLSFGKKLDFLNWLAIISLMLAVFLTVQVLLTTESNKSSLLTAVCGFSTLANGLNLLNINRKKKKKQNAEKSEKENQ